MNLERWGFGEDFPLAQRIQRAAFAITMAVIVIFGGSSMLLYLFELPARATAIHRSAAQMAGEALSVELASKLGNNLKQLSQSALVWTALTDSAGREAYLKPFLSASDVAAGDTGWVLLDYRGRPVIGKFPDDAAARRIVDEVLSDQRPRWALLDGERPLLLAARPVLYPYTREPIGVLAGSVDLSALFRKKADVLADGLGMDLVHQGRVVATSSVPVQARHYPARQELRPIEDMEGAPLGVEAYATRNPWTAPLLESLALAVTGAALLGTAVWRVAGAVARRTTKRLNALGELCAAIARKEAVSIPDDTRRDEIGVLARTLRNALEGYRRINEDLAGLVEMRTRALTESEERLELSVKGAKLAVADWDIESGRIEFGAGWEELLGHPPFATDVKSFARLIWPADESRLRASLISHLKGQTPFLEAETRMLHQDGRWLWIHARCMVVKRDAGGRALRVAGTAMDITERKHAEVEVARLSKLNEALLASAGEGIYGVDLDGNCTFVNPAAVAMLGYEPEELLGRNPHGMFHHGGCSGPQRPLEECPAFMTLKDGIRRESEDRFVAKEGKEFPVQMTVTPIMDEGAIVGAEVVFQDISRRKAMEAELVRLATTDSLTGVVNRRRFMEQMDAEVARTRRSRHQSALLMLDIDHFKKVNDTHGHAVGDLVLKHFAGLCQQCLRLTDALGRLGGEEFGILLPETEAAGARQFAERLRRCVEDSPASTEGILVPFAVSIGVTEFRACDDHADSILARADAALYRAKTNGRNRVEGDFETDRDSAATAALGLPL